jgi:hypothetical protein
MYLTTFLIKEGYDVRCPKPGPDVGIEVGGRRIWFEATSPTRGGDGLPDQVPEIRCGEALWVPNEKLLLRYLNSITEKYDRQLRSWLKRGVVREEDAYVIAINPRRLGFEYADTTPPRILQVALSLGSLYVVIDQETLEQVRSGYQFRDRIKKAFGSDVPTGIFHRQEYSGLSGLLCSRIDAVNQPERMGADFQLVPNPWAKALLPETFRLPGTFFRIKQANESFTAIPERVQ